MATVKIQTAVLLSLMSLASVHAGKKPVRDDADLMKRMGFSQPRDPQTAQSPAKLTATAEKSGTSEAMFNVAHPEIRLADGRVLFDASVASFDKKNLTFCIAHRHGIETNIPWGVMPAVWRSACPLAGADVQRGAEQVAAAKNAPQSSGNQEERQGTTVIRSSGNVPNSPSEETDPADRRLNVIKKREDLQIASHAARRSGDSLKAAELQDQAEFLRHYEDNREMGLSHEEAGKRALLKTQDEISESAGSSAQPTPYYGPKPPEYYGPNPP